MKNIPTLFVETAGWPCQVCGGVLTWKSVPCPDGRCRLDDGTIVPHSYWSCERCASKLESRKAAQ